MKRATALFLGIAVTAVGAFLLLTTAPLSSQQGATVNIDNDDIGGVVSSAKGPEAGVWVIAETTDLPTRFARMVVTDDQGRYVLPDLPKASYSIWVRGYGLVDSPKVKATPGKNLNLKAVVAPNDAAAAQYYPAIYWYSMLKIPDASEFGGKGEIPAKITQTEWLNSMKNNGCVGCHQLGQLVHAHVPEECPASAGKFANSEEAWFRRIQSGQVRRTDVQPARQGTRRARPSSISRTGRTASPRASCLMPSPRDRKAWSATSSSPPGIGSTTSITCTT